MSLTTLLLVMLPSRSDLLLLGWLSEDRVIENQTRPSDHKIKTIAKVFGVTVQPSGHLKGCH
ncbi:hypothetical protein TorRG33x02_138410 [Trema orientale]|uniref:Uncharacterized protein n=1 Tax=Trema orientale TaxID=63057 RepID=A0A2P5EXW3_TREOI|nr:hypothetical protein TorRG33x02_138410 [Trema orientale]